MDGFTLNISLFFTSFIILLLLQNWTHKSLFKMLYAFTGSENVTFKLYVLILFPGVVLHELSHGLTAILLGVKVASFSLIPQLTDDGKLLQLGYVEYYERGYNNRKIGAFRKFLIGVAPLVYGFIFILIASFSIQGPSNILGEESLPLVVTSQTFLWQLINNGYHLIYLYLFFAVCNTMMPSFSDVLTWLPFLGIVSVLVIVSPFIRLQISIDNIVSSGNTLAFLSSVSSYLTVVFVIIIVLNLLLLLIANFFERLNQNYQLQ